MLVQLAGLLHVLLVAESQVCDLAIEGTDATAAARIAVRNNFLPARMRVPFVMSDTPENESTGMELRQKNVQGHHSRPRPQISFAFAEKQRKLPKVQENPVVKSNASDRVPETLDRLCALSAAAVGEVSRPAGHTIT